MTEQTTEQKTELVAFAGRQLMAVKESENVYVALKPICEALEIDYAGQRRMVMNDDVLKSVMDVVSTTGADGKRYQMLCLPLDYLNGWLFRIKASHFPESKRALIIRYQKECYRALAEHFQGGRAEAAVAAAVMKRALRYELNDRRYVMRQLGGLMKLFAIGSEDIGRLAKEAADIVALYPDRPATVIPLEAWADDGSEPVAPMLRRAVEAVTAEG